MNEYVIKTTQLTKKFGSFTALEHVNIHVKKGSIYGLIGDNGAGKTTLLKLLTGLLFPTEGELSLLGKSGQAELENARKSIGSMIEQPGFFPNLTVEQNLNYYSIQKGIPDRNKITEMLELTGLTTKKKTRCKNLSLGQKQRLGLAIALIGEPRLLLLDEPINGLDPSGIVEIRALLHRLNEEKNITVLLSSHILSELEQLADTYGFLSGGRLIEEISADALHEKCADCLELKLSDPERYAALLEMQLPEENYRVFPDKLIRIYSPGHDPEFYSRLALDAQICITEMQTIQSSLEDYYIELKKRGAAK